MSLRSIKGNHNVIKRLMQAVENNKISHAYILEGDLSVDKLQIAENFVKAILCLSDTGTGDSCESCTCCKKINHGNHEDLIYVKAEGNSIKDEEIFQLQSRLNKKPYWGNRNIAIIENADTMTLRAQNRLLKTLEEPPAGTVIILLSENIENLAQTILSRAIIYRLNSLHVAEGDNMTDQVVRVAEMLLRKRPFYEIVKGLEAYIGAKETAYEFLDVLETWYRDVSIFAFNPPGETGLLYHQDRIEAIKAQSTTYKKERIHLAIGCIEEARGQLNRNMNIGYTLKNMVLHIIA